MLRRSLFACALMLAGVVGFASSAKAATATVGYTGSVGNYCTLGIPVPGTLGVNATNDGLGTTAAYSTSGTPLAGTIPLKCSKDTTINLTVNEVGNPTMGTTMTATLNTSDVDPTVTGLTGTVGTNATLTQNLDETPTLDLIVTPASGTFLPGTYNYSVVVTSTP